jgi:hypothetical protein
MALATTKSLMKKRRHEPEACVEIASVGTM